MPGVNRWEEKSMLNQSEAGQTGLNWSSGAAKLCDAKAITEAGVLFYFVQKQHTFSTQFASVRVQV